MEGISCFEDESVFDYPKIDAITRWNGLPDTILRGLAMNRSTALPALKVFLLLLPLTLALPSQPLSAQIIQQQAPQALVIPQDWMDQAIAPESRSIDFGTVARAVKTEHEFVITNPFNQPLHLQSVRASCGCTTPTIRDSVIPVGGQGIVHARYNTDRFTGEKKAALVVTVTKPFFTELQLNVKGYIRSDIVLTPGEIEFGQVAEGADKTLELRLDYAGRSDWKIVDLTSDLPFVKVSAEEVSRQIGRIQYKLIATVDSSAPAGMLENQVILHTNDRRLTSVPLPLSMNVVPSIQFSPMALALGSVAYGDESTHRLVVKGDKPFKILSVQSEQAEVRFAPGDAERKAHMLNIGISPKAERAPGPVEGELLVQTSLSDKPLRLKLSYEIPLETLTRADAK